MPFSSKAWIALRTVYVAQPRFRAITLGHCFRLEASKIWLRRRVKASEERNPASIPSCSSSFKVLTYIGAFIPLFYQLSTSLHKSLFEPALRRMYEKGIG